MKCLRFVGVERADHSSSLMCRAVGVSRSGFYAWERRPRSAWAVADAVLTERIRAMCASSRDGYGARRIYVELREKRARR